MIEWPASLQQYLNEANFQEVPGETVIETEMDVGRPKRRRRSTAPVDNFTCSIDIHKSDYNTLKSFYNTTLNGGVSSFEFDHPITQDPSEFKMKLTGIAPLGGEYFRASMEWELQ